MTITEPRSILSATGKADGVRLKSGELLRAITVRLESIATVVRTLSGKASGSGATPAVGAQPSSIRSVTLGSNRPARLEIAPRPLRGCGRAAAKASGSSSQASQNTGSGASCTMSSSGSGRGRAGDLAMPRD